VTNVGNTFVTYAAGATTNGVNDDLMGVSPGTAVTGFYPPGTDSDGTSAIYAAGYNPNSTVPANAQSALTVAYNTAAGRPASATFAGGTDLSITQVPGSPDPPGTFPAGVYKSPTTFAISSGNLTLDGGGNAQSVFIFQMGTTLTTGANGTIAGNVKLENGASACNVYWQVGQSATLGGAGFYGNVLANQSITINATSFTGRALAANAAVSIPVAGGSLVTNPGGS
jgi:type VI secretion system secreted protein VgrG